ncbi:MAG TPA: L-threonylcarbamoyladenylate synthase [Gemmatimonadaceae bacterium]|jgi:L-threonylcarbamoyladenylate synthase
MRVIRVDPDSPEPSAIDQAAEILRRGGLVAFPTETVYGLGANALDAAAVERIYSAKGRPSFNPLIVHIPNKAAARDLASRWPERASLVANAFWPGPVTIVVPKRPIVPDNVTAGLDSVALRVPANRVALALLVVSGLPLAAPSANQSTELSPTTARHVERSLGDRVDLILDGGPTSVGIESTVLDLRGPRAAILRPGVVGRRELEPLVGPIAAPNDLEGEGARPSPGMMERHYAPRARLVLFDREDAHHIFEQVRALAAESSRVGMLLRSLENDGAWEVVRMPDDSARYAQRLYAALHELDELGCRVIYVERVPNAAEWAGVRDRLERASR